MTESDWSLLGVQACGIVALLGMLICIPWSRRHK